MITLGNEQFGLRITQVRLSSPAFRTRAIARGYNHMGVAAGNLGDLKQAEWCFRKAIELSGPDSNVEGLDNLGLVLLRRRDIKGAKTIFGESAARNPDSRMARRNLAMLAEREGNIAEAIRWWREVAERSGDPAKAKKQIDRLRGKLIETNPP